MDKYERYEGRIQATNLPHLLKDPRDLAPPHSNAGSEPGDDNNASVEKFISPRVREGSKCRVCPRIEARAGTDR